MSPFSPDQSSERPIHLLTPTSRRSCSTCQPSDGLMHFLAVTNKRGRGLDVAGGHILLPATVFPTAACRRLFALTPLCFCLVCSPHFHSLVFSHCGCYVLSLSPGGRDLHTSASSLNACRRRRRPFFPAAFCPRVNGQRLPSFSRSADLNGGK